MYFYLLEQQTDFLKYWTTRKALGDTAPPPPTFLPIPPPTPLQLYRLPDYLPFCVVDFYGELLVPIVQVF